MSLFISLILLLIIVGLYSITRFSIENIEQQEIIRTAELSVQQALTSAYQSIQYNNNVADKEFISELTHMKTELDKLIKNTEQMEATFAAIETRTENIAQLYDRIISLNMSQTADPDAQSHLEDKLISELNILMEDSLLLGQSVTLARQQTLTRLLTRLLLLIFALALLPIIFNLVLAQRFAKKLKALVRSTSDISKGQLSTRLDIESQDEFGLISQSINQMLNSLRDLTYSKAELEDIVQKRTEELNHQAMHDSLTGVLNRRALMLRLEQEVQRANRYGHPLSILFLDLDFFKQVNDTYGHIAGDKVLQEVCLIIQGTIRDSDILARYGGEEFAILSTETPIESARELAVRIKSNIASQFSNHAILKKTLTVSIGISQLFPGEELSQLFSRADNALYEAKRKGRNRIVIYDQSQADNAM